MESPEDVDQGLIPTMSICGNYMISCAGYEVALFSADTSISWCSNGVTGSLAYHAYEAGYDVWLGNCRASPPRRHQDSLLPSHHYWNYCLNELGQKDVGAQLEHIHRVRTFANMLPHHKNCSV